MPPNYALERSVRAWQGCAAGAGTVVAPAALSTCVPRLVVAALATAEFCAKPIDGGVGEPEFCRIYERQEISTPYFSIVVKPDFIVGVLVIAGITLAVMLIVVMR